MPKRRITVAEYEAWLIDMAALRFVEGHPAKVSETGNRNLREAVPA